MSEPRDRDTTRRPPPWPWRRRLAERALLKSAHFVTALRGSEANTKVLLRRALLTYKALQPTEWTHLKATFTSGLSSGNRQRDRHSTNASALRYLFSSGTTRIGTPALSRRMDKITVKERFACWSASGTFSEQISICSVGRLSLRAGRPRAMRQLTRQNAALLFDLPRLVIESFRSILDLDDGLVHRPTVVMKPGLPLYPARRVTEQLMGGIRCAV